MNKGKQKATDVDDWKWDPRCTCWRGGCLECYDLNTDCVSIHPPEYPPSDIHSKDLNPGERAMIWGACNRCLSLDLFCDNQVHLFLEKGHAIPWQDCPVERWLSPSGKEAVEKHKDLVKEARTLWENMDDVAKARAKKSFEKCERSMRSIDTKSMGIKVNVKKQTPTRESSRAEDKKSLSQKLMPDLVVNEPPPPSTSLPGTPETPTLRTPKCLTSPPAISMGFESPSPNRSETLLERGPFTDEKSQQQRPSQTLHDKVGDDLTEENDSGGISRIEKLMTDTIAEMGGVRKQILDLEDGDPRNKKKKKSCCKHKKGKKQKHSG